MAKSKTGSCCRYVLKGGILPGDFLMGIDIGSGAAKVTISKQILMIIIISIHMSMNTAPFISMQDGQSRTAASGLIQYPCL